MQRIERLKPGGRWNGIFFTALFLVIAVAPVGAVSNDWTEEFTNTTYWDAANTTANWNTGVGRLELWQYDAEPAFGNGYGVACDGDLVILADGVSGCRLYDASAPQNLIQLSNYNTSGTARDCVILGTKCYVADGQSGYLCLDITDPSAPFEFAHLNRVQIGIPAGHSFGIDTDGICAYLADGTAGLVMIDALALFPTGPKGVHNTPGTATDVDVEVVLGSTIAFISDGSRGLQIADVTFPAAPVFKGEFNTSGYAEDVVVRQIGPSLYAFVADGTGGLVIIPVDNLGNPGPAVIFPIVGGYAYGVRVEQVGPDLVAFVATDLGVVAVNVTNPGLPAPMGDYVTASSARCVTVCGSVGWAATNTFGVEGFDATDIENRYVVADNVGQSLPLDALPDVIYRVRVTDTSEDRGTVALEISSDGGTSFQSYDARGPGDTPHPGWPISTPNLGWETIATPGSDLVFRETLTKDPTSGASPNPGSDRLKFEWLINKPVIETAGEPNPVPNPSGDVDPDNGFQVRLTWTRSAKDFAGESPQVTEYEIYRKIGNAPVGLESVTPSPGIELAGYDFVAEHPAGAVDDLYSIVVPTLANDTPTTFLIRAVTTSSGTVYDSYTEDLTSVDNLTVTQLDAKSTPVVESRSVPMSLALHRSSPNPFRGIALIRYDVPGAGADVKLGVYDITGRLVRSLVDGAQSAGQKSVAWDARDHGGRAVAPGMYLLRMQAPGFSGMQKIMLTQ